jgi:replicative DNA helicase
MAQFSTAAQASPQFPFARDFQLQLLGLLYQDFDFLAFTHELLHPDWFADDVLAWYFTTMKDHFIDYQLKMEEQSLRNELRKAVASKRIKAGDISSYASAFKKIKAPIVNKPYISAEVSTFCQHQAIRRAAMDTPALLQANDFEALREKWKETFQVGIVHDVGTEYFVSYPERIRLRSEVTSRKIMPIGITELDIWLGGGLKPKQLGLWMAPTNRGKTLALIHCGKRAVIAGKSVLHYTLELSEDEIAERYDSAFSKIPMSMLADREGELLSSLESSGIRWGNSLIVKEFSTKKATVGMILAHYRMCLQMGFDPDLVIVDYLNLIKPTRGRKNKREELTDIAEELRGAAGETGIPWWSATQSRRNAISMETHGEEEVGEDIGMINTSDVTVTLNQTEEELFQEIMRCFLAKNRNGPKYRTVKIATRFDRMCFYDPIATSALATSTGTPNSSVSTSVTTKSGKKPAKKKGAGKGYSPTTGGLIRT